MRLRRHIVLVLCLAAAFNAAARPVSHEGAMRGAEDWISRSKARRHLRSPSGDVRTVSLDGTNLFHMVALDGGGFVTVSADDESADIRGFSSSGEIPDMDEHSPLWALLLGDKAKVRSRRHGRLKMERRHVAPKRKAVASTRAERSLSAAGTTHIKDIEGIDDLRVAPLIQSMWDQQKVGGKKVYNYYTPNGYCCGCVATAMAQLMRFHEYPRSAVTAQTFLCYIGEDFKPTNMTMKGGPYDCCNMPLVPASTSTISDEEREAIGRLCYDVGVSMRISYGCNGDSSGTFGGFEFDPLKEVFHYSNACSYVNYQQISDDDYEAVNIDYEAIEKLVLANLDAGFPVLLGIVGDGDLGHSIIADGYGYTTDGMLYCHLNMGWSGEWDYWYALPSKETPAIKNFNCIVSVVYNIFPENRGELVTGRVVDPSGNAATNAVVLAEVHCDGRETYTTNLAVSATGVYSLIVPSTTCTTTLCAEDCGKSWASTNSVEAETFASISPSDIDFASGYYYGAGMCVGNSWGNDLYLAPVVEAEGIAIAPLDATSPSTSGFTLSFEGTCGAWYTVLRSELLPPDWTVYTNIQVSATGEGSVVLPMDSSTNSCFYCITPRNMIQ